MSVEGHVRVLARFADGRISSVAVTSQRPLAADRLLSGRTPDEALAILPNLYAVCGRSQAVVAAAALAAAQGQAVGLAIHRRRERELAAETAAEHAFRLLLDWPRLSGHEPDVALLSRIRSLLSSATASESSWGVARDALIGMTESRILGLALDPWLEQFSAAEWLAWARSGGTETARMMAAFSALPAWQAMQTPLLSRPARGTFVDGIARRALAEPGFAALPVLDGVPAECGPLARGMRLAAIRDLTRRDLLVARAFSRLAEFGQVLREETLAGRLEAASLGPGIGAAMGEMARGLLVHAVQVEDGRISHYAIVAPTEWNFHPRGALYRELEGRPVHDAGQARRALELAAATLDPCVALEAELRDA
jgi:coenzyme F420-reducing hydrogenase alpha subunit